MKILVPVRGMTDASIAIVQIGHKQLRKWRAFEKLARKVGCDSLVFGTRKAVIVYEESLLQFCDLASTCSIEDHRELQQWFATLYRVPDPHFYPLPAAFNYSKLLEWQSLNCFQVERTLTIGRNYADVRWTFYHPEDDSIGETSPVSIPALLAALPKNDAG